MVLQPRDGLDRPGLGYSAFARHYSRNHSYFLLLWVLRCFSSPRSPRLVGDGPPARRVAPFGHPRIKGYLLLPVACRSLSRPSSPPRAKASTVCPCLLSARRTIKCGLIYLKLALLVFSTRLSTLDVQHVKDPFYVENNGFEPLTLCLQSRCSSQLS